MLRKLKKVFALLHQARKFRTKFVAKKHKIVGDAFISSTVFGNFVAVELMKVDISHQYIVKDDIFIIAVAFDVRTRRK